MDKNEITILKVNFSALNFSQILEYIRKYLRKIKNQKSKIKIDDEKPLVIFTPNPEIVVYAQRDEEFRKIVNSAQIKIPDGQGIIWASRILGQPLTERISGVDLMEALVKLAADQGLTIGLIGGGPGIAVKALECLRKKYPTLKGILLDSPSFRLADNSLKKVESIKYQVESKKRDSQDYFEELVEEIAIKKIDILFVGLGVPKQEYFIKILNTKYLTLNTSIVLMSIGGAFDYFAGRLPRAPLWLQKRGLEWLFRLIRQPWRLRRQLALLKFVWLVRREKFASKN